MYRVITALVVALAAGTVAAQDAGSYAPSDNPFQADYAITIGQPVTLHVEVAGIRLDDVTVKPVSEVTSGEPVRCDVTLAGRSEAERKEELTVVLLLEDRDVKALKRLSLDPFKVKAGKVFRETQRLEVDGDALTAAQRVYVFVEVAP